MSNNSNEQTETPFASSFESLQTISQILTHKELQKHFARNPLMLGSLIEKVRDYQSKPDLGMLSIVRNVEVN